MVTKKSWLYYFYKRRYRSTTIHKRTSNESYYCAFNGRVAEYIFGDSQVTTGAVKDLEDAHQIAFLMITKYGMGLETILPMQSDQFREFIDMQVHEILNLALEKSYDIIRKSKTIIEMLKYELIKDHCIHYERVKQLIELRYQDLIP